jgi:hypothetical protein
MSANAGAVAGIGNIVSRSAPLIPPCPAASAFRFATCHAVNVNTVDPVTGTAGVVVVSPATVATPTAARVVSNCCTPPAADDAGADAAAGLVTGEDAEVTADVTTELVCAGADLVPPDRQPDATSATATTTATFHFTAEP